MHDDTQDQHQVGDANEWLNDNEELSVGELNKLAKEGTPEAMEQLRAVADDKDVEYDDNTSARELVDRIRLAMDEENEINHG